MLIQARLIQSKWYQSSELLHPQMIKMLVFGNFKEQICPK